MGRGLAIYQGKQSWNWLAIQIIKGGPPTIFHWHFSTNKPYKQWFAQICLLLFYFQKNNSEWVFGVSFILFSIQLKYQPLPVPTREIQSSSRCHWWGRSRSGPAPALHPCKHSYWSAPRGGTRAARAEA